MAVLVVSLVPRADKDARPRFVNYGPDTARPDDGPPSTREVKDRFFVDVPAAARATEAMRQQPRGGAGYRWRTDRGRNERRYINALFERNSLSRL